VEASSRNSDTIMSLRTSSILFYATVLLSALHYFIHGYTITFLNPSIRHKKYLHSCKYNDLNPRISNRFVVGSVFDDFEEFSSSDSSAENDELYADLRARQSSLARRSNSKNKSSAGISDPSALQLKSLSSWKNAQCSSTIRLALGDWIRRVAVHSYPLAVCGSADGSIFLADLESGEEFDCVRRAHLAQIHGLIQNEDMNDDSLMAADAMKKLYGMYDGGGVVCIAVYKDLVVSSGREGGMRVFTIDGEGENHYKGSRGAIARSAKLKLKSEGMVRGLDSTLVTSMAFDHAGLLWVGGYDGVIRGYECDNKDKPLVRQSQPFFEIDIGSKILSVSVNNELGCGVAGSSSGKVFLFSIEDGEIITEWKPFGKRNVDGRWKREYVLSSMIVKNDEAANSHSTANQEETIWSVVCGGSEGTMYQRRLNIDNMGYVSEKRPLTDEFPVGRMQPAHSGSVVALDSPYSGLLVSGSQDGTIRVWDCSYRRQVKNKEELMRPRCLYALTGYKVWLGSIFTNHNKLVSDGADNTIVVHDFSGQVDNGKGFLYEGEEGDDFEGQT